jgi:hypothetical protein
VKEASTMPAPARQRHAALALLALLLAFALTWSGPNPSAADSSASLVHLPLIIRDGLSPLPTLTSTATATILSVTQTAAAAATTTPTETPSMICFPTSGTYPITVRDTLLNAVGFVNPDGYYTDETYQNKTWKRVRIQDAANPSGGFNWLRWRAQDNPGNAVVMTAMLTDTGNLSQGFNEAAWPDNPNLPPKPAEYPFYPGQFNIGDWVYGNSGIIGSSSIKAALDYHIANRTRMTVPIYDFDDGGGINGNYHVARPGTFLLIGYLLTGSAYLDLVYIEQPATVPCTG